MKIIRIMHITSLLITLPLIFACNSPATVPEEEKEQTDYSKTTLQTYVYSQDLSRSRTYIVSANGNEQFVYNSAEGQICSFGCDGPVLVKVYTSGYIETLDVMPVSKNYKWEQPDNSSFTIELTPGDRAVIQMNGDELHPLFLFANVLEDSSSYPEAEVFKAGQTYYGNAYSGLSGKTIFIEGGAVIKGRMGFSKSENLKILGHGIIDAYDNDTEVNGLRIQDCTGVTVDGPVVCNNNGRVVFTVQSSDVTLNNVKALGTVGTVQSDAIDLYCNHDVKVIGCLAYSNDDTYCIKSQKYSYKGEVYNIHIEDCIARNIRGNSFEIGYETNMDIHDISFKDIYSIRSSLTTNPNNDFRRGAVTIHAAAAGTVSNISYENVYIEDPQEYGIHMQILKAGYSIGDGVEWAPGIINGVHFKNVKMLKPARLGSVIGGYSSTNCISDVTFENLTIGGERIESGGSGRFKITNADVKFK